MRNGLLILALATTSCAPWTKQDTALELAFAGTAAIDWHQTESITGSCMELNPMIGRCGDGVPTSIYFPVAIAVHAAISACLPKTWRTVFQAFTVGVEAATIVANDQEGFEML